MQSIQMVDWLISTKDFEHGKALLMMGKMIRQDADIRRKLDENVTRYMSAQVAAAKQLRSLLKD
jgi:hypothetical protein